MAQPKRKLVLPRRRRHDDEGEEDGSDMGDAGQYASSEGSSATNPGDDGNVSEHSAEGHDALSPSGSPELLKTASATDRRPRKTQNFPVTADAQAMRHGLKAAVDEPVEEIHFDDVEKAADTVPAPKNQFEESNSRSIPTQPSKQRSDALPPAQPRKGYFLHDDRSAGRFSTAHLNHRGRGRGFVGPTHRSNFVASESEAVKQWAHDLHDSVNAPAASSTNMRPQGHVEHSGQPLSGKTTTPNRSFSTTTVLGNVPINISVPGSEVKKSATMVKKHYTLLPQHRPPLRRDKPVRISIPDDDPRHVFPSVDRSFIFIPRAMRPNQQQFRGRGRGSFHGSRRTSMYSAYTPSIGMSRRPSFAGSNLGSGYHTPTGAPMVPFPPGMQRPVVRMPTQPQGMFPAVMHNMDVYLGDDSAIIHSPPATLPMHQPTPQKTISVEHIESPTRNVPQQQPQQPFYHQIPQDMQAVQVQHKMPHIPEGAIYAQPFQPHPHMQHPGFYPMPFSVPPIQSVDQFAYNQGMNMDGSLTGQAGAQVENHHQQGDNPPVVHETNGMVYYYNPAQQYMPPSMAPAMNIMPAPYYYPNIQNTMFYQ